MIMNEDIIFKYFPALNDARKRQITELLPLYTDWNSKINVISRKDMDNFYLHHVLHSLAIYDFMDKAGICPTSILDAGTGGGFPGIPLAIAMPQTQFTLCDSIAKKLKVVDEVAASLGLANVRTVWSRTEAVKDIKCDFVVSRGVTTLPNFLSLAGHLAEKGIIYLKGGDVQPEIDECISKHKISPESVRIMNLSSIFEEDFFETKKIICIFKQKHYLCTPFVENS